MARPLTSWEVYLSSYTHAIAEGLGVDEAMAGLTGRRHGLTQAEAALVQQQAIAAQAGAGRLSVAHPSAQVGWVATRGAGSGAEILVDVRVPVTHQDGTQGYRTVRVSLHPESTADQLRQEVAAGAAELVGQSEGVAAVSAPDTWEYIQALG